VLPDFSNTRKKLDEIATMQMRIGVHHSLGVLNQIRFKITREGNATRLIREDGTVEDIESRRIAVNFEIPVEEAEKWNPADSARKLAELSSQMARKEAAFVYEKLDEAVTRVGNVIDAKGNLTAEHYFEMLTKIRLDFDSAGNPRMPQPAGGAAEKLLALESTIFADPKLRARRETLIDQKREEWRAREADRTLVG
jgi:hypothetical protein